MLLYVSTVKSNISYTIFHVWQIHIFALSHTHTHICAYAHVIALSLYPSLTITLIPMFCCLSLPARAMYCCKTSLFNTNSHLLNTLFIAIIRPLCKVTGRLPAGRQEVSGLTSKSLFFNKCIKIFWLSASHRKLSIHRTHVEPTYITFEIQFPRKFDCF